MIGAPVEIDEHGLFNYRMDLMVDQPNEVRRMRMRIALGRISEDYRAALDKVTGQVRHEVHATK